MPIRSWSTTPAQNNAAPPLGWPEGMPPSGVNDSARQMMADTRAGFEDMPWLEWPDAVTYANATTFVVATDLRGRYPVGRRLRVSGAATGVIYGTITASAFAGGQTVVTLAWDAGALQSETLSVATGPAPLGLPIGLAAIKGGDQLATLSAIAQAQVPVGSIVAWPLEAPPDGYLLCDGAEVSRATYAALFAAIGVAYGTGNGTTTFTLPDYRRRFLFGAGGTGSVTLANTIGAKGGNEDVSLTSAQMPPHKHKMGIADNGPELFVYGATGAAGTDPDIPGGAILAPAPENFGLTMQGWTSTVGGSGETAQAHSNMPPAVVVNWCVRWRATAGAVADGGGGSGAGASSAVLALGNMGVAKALDTLTYGAFTGTLNQPSCAVTLDNPNLGAALIVRTVRLIQDAVGGRLVTWPANVAWRAGAPPALGPAAAQINDVTLTSFDGGTNWWGAEATVRIEGVAGLATALDAKADDGHGHEIADIAGLADALAAAGGGSSAVPVVALGSMGAAKAINTGLGGAFTGTLNAASCAVTLSDPALGATYVARLLRLTQDATGGRVATWPANVTWQGGYAPALGPAAGAQDVILLTSFDGGAHWYAAIAGQYPGA